eukprot:CAMPEP_0185011920 /NCGR_PEP_ID=MMETSP1098-20130426/98039_1 /TAXON_ID=89044 /ORGANISM="Spumella elongata, Strain CCAP 955/1" /LENGTH=404 /DNA_ID=CAMNT_0027540969 /DNA_START=21 /DNA_END=1236 /DNA_ORIENTATION=+
MTGDGVNDAPALKRADIGVAVHGATDAARAAADIVLTQPGLSTIVEGIIIARRIFVRISNFLTYRIAATLQLLVFFFIAVFAFKPNEYMPHGWETNPDFYDKHEWPSFFKMPVLMLMLITLLNDGTLIAIGYDNAKARDNPEKWNLPVLYLVSSVLAAVSCLSSLVLLYLSLSSWEHGNVYQAFGIDGLAYGQITASIYLKVSISDFLTLFSARTGPDWFWTTAPAPILLSAGCLALTASTIIACVWPGSNPDNVPTLGLGRREPYPLAVYIWLYCIAWWFVQDACKVGTYYLLKKYNIFGAGCLALTASTIIACVWPGSNPDNVPTLGLGRREPYPLAVYIWLYCIAWWFVQDACKVGTYYLLKKYNIFGYNDTGKLVMPASALKYIADNKEKDMQSAETVHH